MKFTKRNKFLSLLMTVLILFSLAACSGGTAENSSETTDSNDVTDVPETTDIFGPAELEYPAIEDAVEGDIVQFGLYDIDEDTSEREYIEWVVLSRKEDKLLLLSRYIIKKMRFGTNHLWETSEVREWLNSDFYTNSFNDNEKLKIQRMITSDKTDDLVFCLSAEEARVLIESDDKRVAYISGNVSANGFKDYNGKGDWWTRSVSTATNGKGVVIVETDGNVRSAGSNPLAPEEYVYTDTGVRPAVCVDLSGAEENAMNMVVFGQNSDQGLDNEPMPGGNSGNNGSGNSSSNSGGKQRVTCTICNGTGEVKYYYGDTDYYNMGICTSCDGKGYNYITPSGDSGGGTKKICGSCGSYVDSLITEKDKAGEYRTWCSSCWSDYNSFF